MLSKSVSPRWIRALPMLAASLALSFPAAAEDAGRTTPSDRASKASLNLTLKKLSSMQPSEGASPKTVQSLGKIAKYGTGDGPGGQPGDGSFELAGFCRFLQVGLEQSYGKTYEAGWKILHTVVQRSLTELGPLPDGVRIALESGRDASYDRSWQDAYKILHEAANTVAKSPENFVASPQAIFGAYTHLARQSSYDKSYEVGWKVLEKYLANLESRGRALIPSAEMALLVRSARKASYELSWKAAYEVQHVSVQRMETTPSGDLKGFFYDNALRCSFEKTWEEGYKILRAFINEAMSSGLLNNFDRASLQTSLQASYNQSWQAGYEVLRDGLKALTL